MAVNLDYQQPPVAGLPANYPFQGPRGPANVSGPGSNLQNDYASWLNQQGYRTADQVKAGYAGGPADPGFYQQWLTDIGQGRTAIGSPQQPGSLSPFFIPPASPTKPWDPYNYQAPLALRNTNVAGIESQMGGGGMPYENSPGNPRLMETLAALEHMARNAKGGFGSEGGLALEPGQIQQGGYAGRSALLQQEPGRLQNLLQLLLGEYTGGGELMAQQAQQEGASRTIKAGSQRQKAEALSQIPIVGSLVGGGFI